MADTRERILTCACELYLTDGLDGFSMRKLARSVGVTAPALYRHYEGKEAVLVDVIGEAYKLLAEYLYRALEGGDALERFRRAGDGYLDFALENPRLYEVLYASPDSLGIVELPDELCARIGAVGQFWHDRLRELQDEGYLKEGDPRDVGMTMWSHAHGIISLYLRGFLHVEENEFRKVYRASSTRVLRGVATDTFRRTVEERRRKGSGVEAEPRAAVEEEAR